MKYKDKFPIAIYDPFDVDDQDFADVRWQDFEYDLKSEFNDHVGKEVYVVGKDMGWQKRTGKKKFDLKKEMDIFYQIKPNTNELCFHLYKMKDNHYVALISHHDAIRETYEIKLGQVA
jgi:hypothetical protein